MIRNILWEGIEYHSLENCLVTVGRKKITITSVIIGEYRRKIFKVNYQVETNKKWETRYFEITITRNGKTRELKFEKNRKGEWKKNGKAHPELKGCIDVDISLTPFTNSLPVNRLAMKKGEKETIKVLYVDVLSKKVKTVLQKYTRLSTRNYKFENVPNDFEAKIKVDSDGIVTDYQGLFKRKRVEKK